MTAHWWRHSRRAVILSVGLVFCSYAPAAATLWLAPARDLNDKERLELSALRSDAVVLAINLGYFDTLLVTEPSGSATFRVLRLLPVRWLKGDADSGVTLAAFAPIGSTLPEGLKEKAKEPKGLLVFLRRIDHGGDANLKPGRLPLPPKPRDVIWYINSSPYDFGQGVAVVQDSEADSLVAETTRALATGTVEGLARGADLIVVGIVVNRDVPCQIPGGHGGCAEIRIDSTIAGGAPSRSIYVYSLLLGRPNGGQHLLFLRSVGSATYEILTPVGAGAMAIRAGIVLPQAQDLRAVAGRIRTLRATRGNAGRP